MGQSFADVHVALAHAMAGNENDLNKIMYGNEGFAGDIVPPVAKAWSAIVTGEWLKAKEELETVSGDFHRFGGSRAQKDLLEFTYVNVLLRLGEKELARKILTKRRPVISKTAPILGIS